MKLKVLENQPSHIYLQTLQQERTPVLKAIKSKNISAQKTFAPKYFGIYGRPATMRLNRLVYNDDLREKLWDFYGRRVRPRLINFEY